MAPVLATAIGALAGGAAIRGRCGAGAPAWLPGTIDMGAFGPEGGGPVLGTTTAWVCDREAAGATGAVEAGAASALPD